MKQNPLSHLFLYNLGPAPPVLVSVGQRKTKVIYTNWNGRQHFKSLFGFQHLPKCLGLPCIKKLIRTAL